MADLHTTIVAPNQGRKEKKLCHLHIYLYWDIPEEYISIDIEVNEVSNTVFVNRPHATCIESGESFPLHYVKLRHQLCFRSINL